ncbi:peptidylprolyl isomerase [Candidatus Dojkabacteria bacterium]|uniref:Peptidyl-prolyl cis-trans isomerase n=1 Tax=Candidatus Dojkabacteria bacterium TaxID=2099670 RepID=A0A955L154_9BACT|nr:peptidylprolyl isomerase [Candidatus Dojkabacteria bacterium]
MKKSIFIISILVSLFLVTGCVRNTDEVNVTEEALTDNTLTNINTEMINENPQPNKTIVMKTNKGDITIELFNETMPITANNFLRLAQEDFYDGVIFHRVIPEFMIQGGDPDGLGTGGPGYSIPDEFTDNNKNNKGTLSMANSGPDTGGSQFFINLVDNNYLDEKHPVFGKVVSGIEVVEAIGNVETGPNDKPLENIIIEDIVIN